MKISKKIVSVVLVCLMLIGTLTALPFSVSAKSTDLAEVGGYDTSYTITGNGAADIIGIANKQLGKNGWDLGYGWLIEQNIGWCDRFVIDCASLAGQSAAIPSNPGCSNLYTAVLNAGGYTVSTPQAGDLVFYYCTWSKGYTHVGIMVDGVNSTQGNLFADNDVARVRQINATTGYYHCTDSAGKHVNYCTNKIFVRPNYQGGGTPIKPADPLPGASTLTVTPGTSSSYTAFSWTHTSDTDHYEIWIKNPVDNSTVKVMNGLHDNQFQALLPMGNYYAYVASIDNDRYEAQNSPWWTYSNTVNFTVTDQAFAPTVTLRYGNSFYEFYDITMPWSKAQAQCQAMGGNLVTFDSAEEAAAVNSGVYFGSRNTYWIGYSDLGHEGTWTEYNGRPMKYSNWDTVEPNNSGGVEHYAVIHEHIDYKWNDVSNSYAANPVGFICEYDYDPTYIRCSASEMYNDNRYETYNLLMTWDDAKEYCESIGGHLVTISDKAEADFVNSLVDKGGVSAYWMGISDEGNEGTWTNITGEPMNYTNWEPGEPNNSGSVEHSCAIRYNDGHTWNDLAAKTLTSFICEFEADYKEPFTKPTTAPVSEPVEPDTKPTTAPVTDPVTEPVTEPSEKPNTKPTVEEGNPDSEPVITEPDSEPVIIKPTTAPNSNPTDIPITPSGKMGMEAEVANQETGDILFTYSGVKNAYYYDITFYDLSGEEMYTRSSETTEYTWTPDDNFCGYIKVTAKSNKGKTLKYSCMYSYILMDNEIQLAGTYGDADENFKINIKDATAIQKHLANIIELNEFAVRLADANGDSKVNIKDATTIQKHCANLKPKSQIGQMLSDSYIQKEIFLTEETDSTDPTEATDGTSGDFIEPPVTTEATEPQKPTIAIPTETTEPQKPTVQVITTEATEATDGTTGDDIGADILSVNIPGSGYKTFRVGETFTYNLMLEADKSLTNADASIEYDSSKLRILSTEDDMCKNLETKDTTPIVNIFVENKIFFNTSSSINPIYFNTLKPVISVEFEVIDSGECDITHRIETLGTFYTNEFYFEYGNPVLTQGIIVAPVIDTGDNLSVIGGDGSVYSGKVGDTFTYYLELEVNERFEDIQGYVTYDHQKLKLNKKQNIAEYLPIISKQIEDMYDFGASHDYTNKVTFNGIEIEEGFDFYDKRTLVLLEFEVIAEGTAQISHTIEEMNAFGGNKTYFTSSNQLVTEGISLTTSFE